jgi:hypothetical protein
MSALGSIDRLHFRTKRYENARFMRRVEPRARVREAEKRGFSTVRFSRVMPVNGDQARDRIGLSAPRVP